MRTCLILVVLLLWAPAKAEKLPDLQQVRSSEDLARFIYAMTTTNFQAPCYWESGYRAMG